MPVDFFATELNRWWTTVVIRTGPKELNLRLIEGADMNGLQLHAYDGAFTRKATGEAVLARTEEHVFELCGYEYLQPWERSDVNNLRRIVTLRR